MIKEYLFSDADCLLNPVYRALWPNSLLFFNSCSIDFGQIAAAPFRILFLLLATPIFPGDCL